MKLFKLSPAKAILTGSVFMFVAGAATAGPVDEIALCESALSINSAALQSGDAQPATFKFKERRGASVKKLTFKMNQSGVTEKVTCKVRRGSVVDILDANGDSVMVQSADKADADKNS